MHVTFRGSEQHDVHGLECELLFVYGVLDAQHVAQVLHVVHCQSVGEYRCY